MLKKIFSSQSKTITSAAVIIGAAALVSRFLGILRDRVLAGEFGAGAELDMYYTAFRIPDFIFNIVVLGAISAGFIPVFTDYLKNEKKAWELANVILNIIFIGLISISGLLIVLAPILISLIAPGFNPEQIDITANLTRIMFLSPIFLGISGILSGILQSFKLFFVYSLSPIFYNIGIIIGALFFVPFFGLYGLAFGVILGAFFHMAIQIPAVFALGYRYHWVINFRHKGVVKIFTIMIPRILGLLTGQINFLITTVIGSTLALGSITIFNLANNLQSFPLGIFGVAFAIAAFPTLAELKNKKNAFIKTLSSTTRQILFFILPASALLIILRAQIVRMVLGTGRFDWEDTVLTLWSLSFFAFSLFAQALILLFARAFYAIEDSKTPFFIGLVSALINVIVALLLIDKFQVAGLALAFSFSSILNFILLWLALHQRLGNLDGLKVSFASAKILIATFMLAITAQAIKYLTQPMVGTETFIGIATQGIAATTIGLATYSLVCWILRVEELNNLIVSLKNKFYKKIIPPIEAIENE